MIKLAIQFRNGNEADLDKSQLSAGEPVYCNDSKKAFIGDGAGEAMPIGNMFAADYDNNSGASNPKKVDGADSLLSTFRLSYSNFPVGTTFEWDGPVAPAGTLFKDGSAVSRTVYAALFAVIGTEWGTGDGMTTFNLPNMKGRVLVGRDSTQTEFSALAQKGGEKTHTLLIAELASHVHGVKSGYLAAAGSGSQIYTGSGSYAGDQTAASGSNTAHNNLQPYTVVNYVIVY